MIKKYLISVWLWKMETNSNKIHCLAKEYNIHKRFTILLWFWSDFAILPILGLINLTKFDKNWTRLWILYWYYIFGPEWFFLSVFSLWMTDFEFDNACDTANFFHVMSLGVGKGWVLIFKVWKLPPTCFSQVQRMC